MKYEYKKILIHNQDFKNTFRYAFKHIHKEFNHIQIHIKILNDPEVFNILLNLLNNKEIAQYKAVQVFGREPALLNKFLKKYNRKIYINDDSIQTLSNTIRDPKFNQCNKFFKVFDFSTHSEVFKHFYGDIQNLPIQKQKQLIKAYTAIPLSSKEYMDLIQNLKPEILKILFLKHNIEFDWTYLLHTKYTPQDVFYKILAVYNSMKKFKSITMDYKEFKEIHKPKPNKEESKIRDMLLDKYTKKCERYIKDNPNNMFSMDYEARFDSSFTSSTSSPNIYVPYIPSDQFDGISEGITTNA